MSKKKNSSFSVVPYKLACGRLCQRETDLSWRALQEHSSVSCFQDHLLKEGLAWLDSQAAGEAQYWLPALFSELTSRDVTPEEANQMTP